MKQTLLSNTRLPAFGATFAALAICAAPAAAAEPIKLGVGGFFRAAYLLVSDDDAFGEPGFDRNTDGFFNDAEIHFTGSTVLDNGLEVGAHIELEGETEASTEGNAGNGQIDEAWIWFSGGWGEIRIGSDDDALGNTCITPPGSTANFGAVSPNQWGANNGGDNSVCFGVAGPDDEPDAQKILYISPVFGGFQLSTSYTPDPNAKDHLDGGGPHVGMPAKPTLEADYAVSAYLTYAYQGADWGLTWGGGVSMQADFDIIDTGGPSVDLFSQDFYQTGLTLQFGNFSVGGAFAYFNDALKFESEDTRFDIEGWTAGGGVAYAQDAWTFGAQYSYRHSDFELRDDDTDFDDQADAQRVAATVNYALGPGIAIDGEVGYTWVDVDPEDSSSFFGDDYDGLEFGIGTAITF